MIFGSISYEKFSLFKTSLMDLSDLVLFLNLIFHGQAMEAFPAQALAQAQKN